MGHRPCKDTGVGEWQTQLVIHLLPLKSSAKPPLAPYPLGSELRRPTTVSSAWNLLSWALLLSSTLNSGQSMPLWGHSGHTIPMLS